MKKNYENYNNQSSDFIAFANLYRLQTKKKKKK